MSASRTRRDLLQACRDELPAPAPHALEQVVPVLDRRGLLRRASELVAEHGARALVSSQLVRRVDLLALARYRAR
ncbi:hypothetical protein KDL01_14755 [Actinospica durhamensis]|uniref:Uncharacterized protein n=1 Tax=Actinospica durhamensis TaxID=1508375 RepID=A0A941ENZ0_9ACTN|nr:hypothetical protein [Actinospica durhamensis]MBR7834531.1 hypothetical protein [Actinospica durhamensis]